MAKKINISGMIGWEYYPRDLREALEGETGDLEIRISSPGGDVYDGIEIYNIVREYRAENDAEIVFVVTGAVASIASYVVMSGDRVEVYDNSTMMIHNAWIFASGDHSVMQYWADDLLRTDLVIAKAYADKSGITVDEALDLMGAGPDNTGTTFYGAEIVEAGLADAARASESGPIERRVALAEASVVYASFVKAAKDKPLEYDHERVVALLGSMNQEPTGADAGEGEQPMEKAEMLKRLGTMRANGDLSNDEVAKAFGVEFVNDSHREAVRINSAIAKALGVDGDLVAAVEGLGAKVKANAEAVFNARMTEEFGPAKYEDGTENLVRAQAGTLINAAGNLDAEIEKAKADPILRKLNADRLAVTDSQNTTGRSDKKNNDAGDDEFDRVEV